MDEVEQVAALDNLPDTPQGMPGYDPNASQRLKDLQSQQESLRANQQDLAAKRNAALDPLYAGVHAEIDKQNNTHTPLMQQDLPTFQPKPVINPNEFAGFFGIATIAAALMGRVGRGDMTTGLNALSGAIRGYQQGGLDSANRDAEEFKMRFNNAIALNKQKQDQYKLIIENQNLTTQRKMQELKITAAQFDDQAMQMTLQQQSYDKAIDLAYKGQAQNNTLTDKWLGIQKALEVARTSRENTDAKTSAMKEIAQMKIDAAGDQSSPLSPQTADFLADSWWHGDHSVLTGLGRSKGAVAQVLEAVVRKATAAGYTGEQINSLRAQFTAMQAGARTAAVREANIGFGIHEMDRMAPLALEASAAVPRTNFVPVNKLLQMAANQWSPAQSRYFAANESFINAFAQTIGRGNQATTVFAQQRAQHLLNTAATADQYVAIVDQLRKEAQAALAAAHDVQQDVTGMPGKSAPTTGGYGAPTLPPEARARLREGAETTFGNGQVWTLRGGQPVRVR